ncbi:MAG TPA: hypothetical protein VFJ73_00790 [Bacillales bacterium]|nr:hypothetical protein [Bacillales bacterium]
MNEKLLWSIALPGFGQLLNGAIMKGVLLVILEFLVNIQANFNEVIILSFHGEIESAVRQADYEWLMFYPCLYFFAMWDAYREDGGKDKPYMHLPFVFAAFFVTVGLIYSRNLKIMGILFGPVWLPMLFVIPGVATGLLLKNFMVKRQARKHS